MLANLLRDVRERFRPLRRARQNRLLARYILPILDRPVSVRLHEIDWPVRVRLIRHLTYILDSRIVEPGETALFTVLCRRYRPKVFWDVGANIGLYSWILLSADRTARAVLFEPDPDNLSLLDRTMRDARVEHATVVPCAVSDAADRAFFRRDTLTGHEGRIVADSATARDGDIVIRTVTLDGMLQTEAPPDLVKIDVEGGEAAVIAGASRLIRECRPILLFESFASDRDRIFERLGAAGYVMIGAEYPDGPLGRASNFLALPPHHAADLEAVRETWRLELAARRLGRRS